MARSYHLVLKGTTYGRLTSSAHKKACGCVLLLLRKLVQLAFGIDFPRSLFVCVCVLVQVFLPSFQCGGFVVALAALFRAFASNLLRLADPACSSRALRIAAHN